MPGKDPLLSLDERVAIVNEELASLEGDGNATTEVRPFETLLVDFATSLVRTSSSAACALSPTSSTNSR